MSIENEVKVRIDDQHDFLRRLGRLSPTPLTKRHFEDNFILDDSDRSLRSRQSLVRVRLTGDGAWLTFKGPPRPGGLFKRREELESAVSDGRETLAILRKIGLRVSFRYQKYRREFRIASGPSHQDEVHVALDETPIGIYAEFEGSEAGIKEAARKMAIRQSQFLRDSYASLYIQYCAERHLPVRRMTFRSIHAVKAGRTGRKGQR